MSDIEVPTNTEVALTIQDKILAMKEEPEDIQNRILTAVLNSTTEDELFGEVTTVSSKDYIGIPFICNDGGINESDKFTGSSFFLSIEAEDPYDGNKFILNTSSQITAVKIMKAKDLGLLPTVLEFKQSKNPTANGFYPVDLIKTTDEKLAAYKDMRQRKADSEKAKTKQVQAADEAAGDEPF